MNLLQHSEGRKEIENMTTTRNPRVVADKSYSFGDVINTWSDGKGGVNKIFIRDDNYLMHKNIFVGIDTRSYTFRSIKQTTFFDDDSPFEYTESYSPTNEDLLEHKWYEYIPYDDDSMKY